MSEAKYASLNDDLSADPLHAAVRDVLKTLVEAGHDPKHIVDAGFATVSALSVDVSGLAATSCHLMQSGGMLAQGSPEVRRAIGEHIQALAALIERLPVEPAPSRH